MDTNFSKSLFFIAVLSLFISCVNGGTDNKIKKKTSPSFRIEKADSVLRDCIPRKDTNINSNTSIKYVIIDSFFSIKLKINDIDTILDYKFNCTAPRGLVPVIHSYYKNMICMLRGGGQHFREFVIAYYEGSKIIIKEYETALATDLINNLVIYRNYMQQREIFVENIKTARKKTLTLPFKYANQNILDATIKDKKLILNFSDNKLVLNL